MSRPIFSLRRMSVACVVLTVACTGEPTAPRTAPPPQQPQRLTAVPPQDVVVAPTDDELAQVAASVPAFGGMHFDRGGRLVVFLTDTSRRAAAAAAIGPVLGTRHSAALGDFTVRPARFGFTELRQWRKRLNPEVLSLTGVVFTDIDESRNRVVVAVENAPMRARVAAALNRLQLPAEAVLIEEHAPVLQAQGLTNFRRPPLAGTQIAFSGFFCTHGPAAETYAGGAGWDGISYFMTNSHCTDVQGGVENTQYFQPTVAAGNHIAVEVRDPAYFTGGACPAGRRCRSSDAALIRYDQQWWEPNAFGAIARTTFSGQFSGSLTLANPDHIQIWGFYGNAQPYIGPPFVGQQLNKVGRTTGWTRGAVTNTCVDTNVGGTNFTLFCQAFVNAGSGPGDSGSPVFESVNGGSNGYLYGILWGGSGGTSFVFSPLRNVESELGVFYYCYC